MKHILKPSLLLIGSFVLSVSLKASYGDIVQEYKNKNYQGTINKAQELLRQTPEHIQANLLLGNAAYMLKDYHKAMSAYDRVLILDPDHIQARLQVAQIYSLTSNYELLRIELNLLQTLPLSKEQQKIVENLRAKTPTKKSSKASKHKNFQGVVSVGLTYDSNIGNDMGNKPFLVPALDLTLRGTKEESGIAHFENIYLYGDIKSKSNEHLGAEGSFNLYNKDYFKNRYKSNDLTYVSIKAGPTYTTSSYKLALPLKLEKVLLDYSSYMNTYGIGLDLYRLFEWGLITTGVEYNLHRYSKDKGKDSQEGRLYLGAKKIEKEYKLSAILDFSTVKEKRDLRSDISYDRYGISLDFSKELQTDIYGRLSFNAHRYNYTDFNTKFLNKREDTLFRYGVGVDYLFSANSSISASIDYLDKSSNQAIYEHDKLTLSLYYAYMF